MLIPIIDYLIRTTPAPYKPALHQGRTKPVGKRQQRLSQLLQNFPHLSPEELEELQELLLIIDIMEQYTDA